MLTVNWLAEKRSLSGNTRPSLSLTNDELLCPAPKSHIPIRRLTRTWPHSSYQRGTQELFGLKADKTIC